MLCGFVLASAFVVPASAASYKYCRDSTACGSTVIMMRDSLSCVALGNEVLRFYKEFGGTSRVVSDCSRDFVPVVNDMVTVTYTYWTGAAYAQSAEAWYLVAIAGDVSDEVPVSQLLLTLVLAGGFGLGVIAGQQR